MDLQMNISIADNYNSNSQKIRVITENWVVGNLYCPCCGNSYVKQFENNRPVADFYCASCREEYELKSKNGTIDNKIADGAYDTMVDRINSINNPNFLFMNYGNRDLKVKDLIIVPKHFFVPDIIEKRKPLAITARRAGWIGCNILVRSIPEEGKIFLIQNEEIVPTYKVIEKVKRTSFISDYNLNARGWLLDIFNCINRIPDKEFTLAKVYEFVDELALKHPENNHIKDKIRQQLQVLRDKGLIEFKGRGIYRKL